MSSDHQGPSEAMIQLISPDGYYTYLGIPKPTAAEIAAAAENVSSSFVSSKKNANKVGNSGIDEDQVKKAYRKLSLKHHPDKPGGDADTFRVLNRAQKVLMNPKLRQQYDILGLDLDDDDDGRAGGDAEDDDETASQGIVHEIATMAMAGLMHLGVRTGLMGLVAVVVVRYTILFIPALLFMGYVGFSVFRSTQLPDGHPEKLMPQAVGGAIALAGGLVCMYWGRSYDEDNNAQWSWLFWLGESTVMGIFIFNSIGASLPLGMPLYGGIAVFSILVSLWIRGRFWTYVSILIFEALLLLFVVMAFPVMEMVLETILNEKLRKVGDKVRVHQRQLEAYYANKMMMNEKGSYR
ncbi:DnaJ central domain [Seminavis robusta]|uniref:DnaJ central domain n=1 Tax=Seminavis robusta TaxID=568900 RepID=A0A9N8DUH0_9STRA|nr:DnaJ central domain [Seminavis robusta]|eukprot:Sro352_g124150.1 DnaJ central domain (351) ;mRNA; f:17866-19135